MTNDQQLSHDGPESERSARRRHVVIGAGAVGTGVARRLADLGHDVVVVTRSGSGPTHKRVECVAADASNAAAVTEFATGAHAIFNCANPTYSTWATAWPPMHAAMIQAAESSGARLVAMSNLYMYGKGTSPMTATDPLDPPSKKGAIRAEMWEEALEAHRAGRIRTTEVRASDFFGPGVGEVAHLGDFVVPRLLAGKSGYIAGRPDQVHSWSYIGDVCDTLVALSLDDRSLGRVWHVPTLPAVTPAFMADVICDAAGVKRRTIKQIPGIVLRLAGLFSPDIRELREIQYQHVRPFEMDSAETTEVFGVRATPLDEQVTATIASYGGGQPVATRPASAASA